MKLVYTHMNYVLVENAANVLRSAGIATTIKNKMLSSGFGELSGIDSWPELWVLNEADLDRARAILEEAGIGSKPEAEEADWTCTGCSETNAATFDACWQCGKSRR